MVDPETEVCSLFPTSLLKDRKEIGVSQRFSELKQTFALQMRHAAVRTAWPWTRGQVCLHPHPSAVCT